MEVRVNTKQKGKSPVPKMYSALTAIAAQTTARPEHHASTINRERGSVKPRRHCRRQTACRTKLAMKQQPNNTDRYATVALSFAKGSVDSRRMIPYASHPLN